jgi:hypothetical protein
LFTACAAGKGTCWKIPTYFIEKATEKQGEKAHKKTREKALTLIYSCAIMAHTRKKAKGGAGG